MVSNSRSKIHQTTYEDFFSALYLSVSTKCRQGGCQNTKNICGCYSWTAHEALFEGMGHFMMRGQRYRFCSQKGHLEVSSMERASGEELNVQTSNEGPGWVNHINIHIQCQIL